MALSDIRTKHLSATGAISTDGNPGILHYVFVSGDTEDDKVEIKNGATTNFTILVPASAKPVILDFLGKDKQKPIFNTDIDCTITKSGNVFATFLYQEQVV